MGHAPKKFRIYVVASQTILGQYNAARQQSFTRIDIYPFCRIQHCFRLSNHSLTLQVTSFNWKVVGRKTQRSSFTLFTAILQVTTCHLCADSLVAVCRAMALIGNAEQATSEGESDSVETGLTGLVAMAQHM